jgi:hypothetical protein
MLAGMTSYGAIVQYGKVRGLETISIPSYGVEPIQSAVPQ